MDNTGKKMGRFVLDTLVDSAGLTYDQVTLMEARALQNHLLSTGLDKQEILSVKRLRKRMRIKRKDERETRYLVASIKELVKLKYDLLVEKRQLIAEMNDLSANLWR